MLTYPPKPQPGDKVAVISPSAGLPELFPQVYELGLRRLREELRLEPVEYPTTRTLGSSPADRARDIHAAFADPSIRAVMSSIGGDDQLTVLPHLDPDLLRANPKPFFGFSDNTNLLVCLWQLGIVGYHGGSVMVHLGRGVPHPYSVEPLRTALFTSGEVEIRPAGEHTDEAVEWDRPEALTTSAPMAPNQGWTWRHADRVVEGVTFGGCLEVLDWQLAVRRWLAPFDAYDGAVLLIETSEEMPSPTQVHRILRNFGEAGLLQRFAAVLVGRAKAWNIDRRTTPEEKVTYLAQQAAAVRRALDEYSPGVLTVFDVDFGHTDPQLVLPHGGRIRIDGPARRIWVTC
ncbi:MAG: LD-carboxypeptidase [Micromonosporaceae bacterium]|nr:LD-carboxypeptidase [Micromonosporaceae bacterium]